MHQTMDPINSNKRPVRKVARPTKKISISQEKYFATGDDRLNTEYPQALCPCFARIGNMQVIWETTDLDGKRNLKVVLGPSWPHMVCVSLPLLVGSSLFISSTLLTKENDHILRQLYWMLTVWVCIWLIIVAFSDPGIVPHYTKPPPGGGSWPLSNQTGSYRPMGALFSKECNVIVEQYDHTCPWTGNAIGRKNMRSFKIFLVSIATLLVVDVLLVVYRESARSPAVIVFGVLLVGFIIVGLWCCMSSTAHHRPESSVQLNYGSIPTADQVVEPQLEQDLNELI